MLARGPPPLHSTRHRGTCPQQVATLIRRYPRRRSTPAAAASTGPNNPGRSPAAEARRRSELVDLAVLNERLAGQTPPWEARARLELLRGRRREWEAVCELLRAGDAAATLEAIEDAAAQVESALSDEERESTPVAALPARLATLRADVNAAAARLSSTRARVAAASARLDALQSEAAALERARRASSAPHAHEAPLRAAATERAAPATSLGQTESPSSRAPRAEGKSSRRSSRRRHGLAAALAPEPALSDFWYPVEFTSRLGPGDLIPIQLFDEPWVLFRDPKGAAACVRDECAHRACPLSAGGRVVGGEAECPYHGWRFSASGDCTKMPSTRTCRGVRIDALPVAERGGFVWVWPGAGPPSDDADVPSAGIAPPEGYQVHAELEMIVPVEHGLLVENLLDLAHAPFTHQGTFAKGWPVPESVKFHARRALGGAWDPYPVDMAFQPPCMTVSRIGLVRPGRVAAGAPSADACARHIHQVHACLPAGPKSTRLLYRMSMDFMGWARHVPFIAELWKGVAGQVLGEDLKLVVGQQARLEAGGDTWSLPVPYDQMGVRYRRWRNTLKKPPQVDGQVDGAVFPEQGGGGQQLPRAR